jgi:hypothetical protein
MREYGFEAKYAVLGTADLASGDGPVIAISNLSGEEVNNWNVFFAQLLDD